MTMIVRLCPPLICAAVLALAAPAIAQEVDSFLPADDDLSGESVTYRVIESPVAVFLEQLARDTGTRLALSDKIRGQVIGTTLEGQPSEILDDLARAHDLDWFAYNQILYVSARSEALTRMVHLADISDEDAVTALESSGLSVPRFPIMRTADRTVLAVSGPPRYLALVEATLEAVPPSEGAVIRERRGTEALDVELR